MKKLLNHTLLTLSSLVLGFAPGFAGDYSNFYIFGDSLSDAGNTQNGKELNDGGRYSNGPVWNEYLATLLGMSVPTKSTLHTAGETPEAGHTNFSYGGAVTNNQFPSLFIPSVTKQINDETLGFRRYGTNFASNDLVAIWAGANNLILSQSLTEHVHYTEAAEEAAQEMLTNVNSLIKFGAQNIIVFNLPDIGITPEYAGNPEGAANATLFTNTFNSLYSSGLTNIQIASPQVTFTSIDIFTLFNDILENPNSYGLTETQTTLLTAYAADPNIDQSQYLFYDEVHPSTAMHKILANKVYQQLVPEPSTVTLSLLALTGLLARRRRKAAA